MDLGTTNLLLGILAAVSVLEAVALIVGGVAAYRLYTRTMRTVEEIEARHVAPLVSRVDAVMGKVDGVLVKVDSVLVDLKGMTERTPGQSRVSSLVTLASGAKQILGGLFNGRRSSGEAPGETA